LRVCEIVLGLHVSEVAASYRAARYFVSGIVQGVGYRFFARRTAIRLGLTGFAKNLDDGRVEVYGIGTVESLAAFRNELSRGPQGAAVSAVTEEAAPLDPLFAAGFSIER
jgi:acylphosphatase